MKNPNYENEITKDDLLCSCNDVKLGDPLGEKLSKLFSGEYEYAYCIAFKINENESIVQFWETNGPYLKIDNFAVVVDGSIDYEVESREQMIHYLGTKGIENSEVALFLKRYDSLVEANKGNSGMF